VLVFYSVCNDGNPVREERRAAVSPRPADLYQKWVQVLWYLSNALLFCYKCSMVDKSWPVVANVRFSAVLEAMRDDSDKVPSLLTDYILKGIRDTWNTHPSPPLSVSTSLILCVLFLLSLHLNFSTGVRDQETEVCWFHITLTEWNYNNKKTLKLHKGRIWLIYLTSVDMFFSKLSK